MHPIHPRNSYTASLSAYGSGTPRGPGSPSRTTHYPISWPKGIRLASSRYLTAKLHLLTLEVNGLGEKYNALDKRRRLGLHDKRLSLVFAIFLARSLAVHSEGYSRLRWAGVPWWIFIKAECGAENIGKLSNHLKNQLKRSKSTFRLFRIHSAARSDDYSTLWRRCFASLFINIYNSMTFTLWSRYCVFDEHRTLHTSRLASCTVEIKARRMKTGGTELRCGIVYMEKETPFLKERK